MWAKQNRGTQSVLGRFLIAMVCLSAAVGVRAQTALEFGASRQDNLSCGLPNVYTFVAQTNDSVVVHATSCGEFGGVCGGGACCCFDVCYELWSPSGALLKTSDCSANSNNCSHRRRNVIGPEWLPESGEYEIRLYDSQNNGRGTYRIGLQRTNLPGLAGTLTSGDSFLASLDACGEFDTYEFSAAPGDWVAIEMTTENGSVVPRLELYDPSGIAIALPESGTIEHGIEDNGFYTLLAFSSVHQTGDYRLTFDLTAVGECVDTDADGFGQFGRISCPGGTTPDCDDQVPSTFPGAPELLDDVDNDCDLSVDEGTDDDGDGVPNVIDLCPGSPSGCAVAYDGCLTCTPDVDSDTFDCLDDCDDRNALVHGDPTEVLNVRLERLGGDEVLLNWDSQDPSNGLGTSYDIVRGSVGDLRSSQDYSVAICEVSGHPDTPYNENQPVNSGRADYFLVVAKSSCGRGTHGTGTPDPDPRAALDVQSPCP